MAVYRSTYEHAKKHPSAMDALVRYSGSEAGQIRVVNWLYTSELAAKCSVQVFAMWNDYNADQLIAHAVVRLKDGGGFEHEEPYDCFPSDHFKTKVLLATGGA